MTSTPLPAPIPDALLSMAERIVQAVQPVQVILFGSHARGDSHHGSDVDLLIVIRDEQNRRQAWNLASRALCDCGVPLDLVVVTMDEVRQRGGLVGTVLRPALLEGIILYDVKLGLGANDAVQHPTAEVDPVTEPQRRSQTAEWLRQASEELAVAALAMQPTPPASGTVCYLAQQSAEKALKSVLVFLQIDYPLTHDLNEVCRAIPTGWPLKEEFTDLDHLSRWAVRGRYPGDWDPPTADDARLAFSTAQAIHLSVLRDLQAHGFVQGTDSA